MFFVWFSATESREVFAQKSAQFCLPRDGLAHLGGTGKSFFSLVLRILSRIFHFLLG